MDIIIILIIIVITDEAVEIEQQTPGARRKDRPCEFSWCLVLDGITVLET